MTENRRILIRKRPRGPLADSDVEMVNEPLPPLEAGEILVKTRLLAMDPVTRVMLATDIGIMPAFALGSAVRSFGAGEVVASRRENLPVGARVTGFFEWADYQRIGADVALGAHFKRLPDDMSWEAALTLHGHTAHAAYFGMIDVAQPTAGQTVVVTGAAGAVGSVAGQIARIKGATVVGVAGGPAKCRWLIDELGFDAAIDYKAGAVGAAVQRHCPQGINIIFDNVGGPLLGELIRHGAPGLRVVLCGASGQYFNDEPLAPAFDPAAIEALEGSAKWFNAMDYSARFEQAEAEMQRWEKSGQLCFAHQTVRGLAAAPQALNSLFAGANKGRLLVEL